MDAKTIVAKGDRHVETLAGSEIILMQVQDGKFFSLTGTARRVWEILDEPLSIEALAGRLTPEFAIEPRECVRDLLALCRDLKAQKLIDVSTTPA